MQSDESLYLCRFCGTKPLISKEENAILGNSVYIFCSKCVHNIEQPTEKEAKEAWQARNEEHNPFLGSTKEEALKKIEDSIGWNKGGNKVNGCSEDCGADHNPFLEGK